MKNKLIKLYKIIREKFHERTRVRGSIVLEYLIVLAIIVFVISQGLPFVKKMLSEYNNVATSMEGKLNITEALSNK